MDFILFIFFDKHRAKYPIAPIEIIPAIIVPIISAFDSREIGEGLGGEDGSIVGFNVSTKRVGVSVGESLVWLVGVKLGGEDGGIVGLNVSPKKVGREVVGDELGIGIVGEFVSGVLVGLFRDGFGVFFDTGAGEGLLSGDELGEQIGVRVVIGACVGSE